MDLTKFVNEESGIRRLTILSARSGRVMATWQAATASGVSRRSIWDAAAEFVRVMSRAGEWDNASTVVQRGVSATWALAPMGLELFALVEFGAGAPLGLVHTAARRVRERMSAEFGDGFADAIQVLREDASTNATDPRNESPQMRAAHVIRTIRRLSADPETLALRVAVRSRVSLDRLLSGSDLSDDEIDRIEGVADELLS